MQTRRRFLALALIALVNAVGNARSLQWIEVQTAHFTVLSGAGESAGLAVADRLEALHRALSRMAGQPRNSAVPTRVYVFANDDHLHPFKPAMAAGRRGSGRAVAGGFFAPRELTNFVAVNAGTAQPISSTIQHELLHQFAAQNLPRLPFWFSEGLAEYYSTFEVVNGLGIIGRPHRGHLRRLTSSPTNTISGRALTRVTELRASKELYDDAGEAGDAYALSWALVHYLLSDDRHADSTLEFMRGLARGMDAAEAFEVAFGREAGTFAGTVARYLIKGQFPEFEIDLSRVPRPRIRHLPAIDRDLALSDLALAVARPALAREMLERAWIQADRSDTVTRQQRGSLKAIAGHLSLLSEDFEGARSTLIEAAQISPGNVRAHLFLARTLLGLTVAMPRADPQRHELIAQARQAAIRARDLAPTLVPALETLAQTWIVEAEHVRPASWPPEDLPVGVRALQDAVAEDPYRADLASRLAVMHALGEELGAALETLRRHRVRYDDTPSWDSVVLQVAQIELRLLTMRSQNGKASDLEHTAVEHRIDALIEFTYEFDVLSSLFAEVRALEEEIIARREESSNARRNRE